MTKAEHVQLLRDAVAQKLVTTPITASSGSVTEQWDVDLVEVLSDRVQVVLKCGELWLRLQYADVTDPAPDVVALEPAFADWKVETERLLSSMLSERLAEAASDFSEYEGEVL